MTKRVLTVCVLGVLMAYGTEDFESGSSLSTLGWVSIAQQANVNGAGLRGSAYGMRNNNSGTVSPNLGDASMPVTPALAYLRVEYDWIHRDATSSYHFEMRAGNGTFIVSLDTEDSDWPAAQNLRLTTADDGFVEQVNGIWPAAPTPPSSGGTAKSIRIEIVFSTDGAGNPGFNADAIVRVWVADDKDSFTETPQYEKTGLNIYDRRLYTIDVYPYSRLHWNAMGDVDNIEWSDDPAEFGEGDGDDVEFAPALGSSFGPILWVEFDDTAGAVTAWGQVDLPDPPEYYHGFKPATILGGPVVRRAMSSDDDGTDEIGRWSARFSDVGRYWSSILGRDDLTRLVLNRRVVLRMISDDGRRALETPRTVSIGLIRSYELA